MCKSVEDVCFQAKIEQQLNPHYIGGRRSRTDAYRNDIHDKQASRMILTQLTVDLIARLFKLGKQQKISKRNDYRQSRLIGI